MALRGSRDLTGFPTPQSPTTHARRLISQHMGFVCVCVFIFEEPQKTSQYTCVCKYWESALVTEEELIPANLRHRLTFLPLQVRVQQTTTAGGNDAQVD